MFSINFSDPRTKAIIVSYFKDWVLVLLLLLGFVALDSLEPFHRKFSLTDKNLMFPYTVYERVPTYLLIISCLVIPLVLIIFIALIIKRSALDLHNGIMGLFLSLALTIMVTEVIKISVGWPRPDFIDRCHPSSVAVDPPFGLSDATICTQTDSRIITDGFKSLPSGHSSMAFGGLTYLSLFLAGKLRVFDQRGHTYKGFIFALPMVGATYIATTRLQDNRHHPIDVVVGGIIGVVFALFAYRQYYPSLHHPQSQKPFNLRILRADNINSIEQGLTADLDLDNDSNGDMPIATSDLEGIRVVEQPEGTRHATTG